MFNLNNGIISICEIGSIWFVDGMAFFIFEIKLSSGDLFIINRFRVKYFGLIYVVFNETKVFEIFILAWIANKHYILPCLFHNAGNDRRTVWYSYRTLEESHVINTWSYTVTSFDKSKHIWLTLTSIKMYNLSIY